MSEQNATPPDVVAFYEGDVEDDRLLCGVGRLEFARTKELVLRFLPAAATVADVGGAVGHYADWLSGLGHRVELADPVARHVAGARARAGEPPRFGVHRADVRALPFADRSFDAVLVLGPVYHLGERADRLAALAEAARISRPGGFVFAAAISRFAPLLDAVRTRGLRADVVFTNVEAETLTGRRVDAQRRASPFPDAYFHRPAELAGELVDAGLTLEALFGVEGPGWLLPELDHGWDDPAVREHVLRAARLVETDADLVAVSPHLLAVARRGTV